MSNYPGQIDILPTVVPNAPIALVPGSVLNAYSAAISNIENAVGIDPAGPYTNVSARFSVLENVIGNIKINLSIPSSSYTYDHTDLSGSLNIDGTINNVSRPTVIGIQGYPVSSAAPDLYNVLTWNGIAWEPLPVITLQSRPVSAAAPTAGYVLTWTGSVWAPAPSSGGGGNFVAGGDLSGIATFQTVVGIQNHSVSSTAPTTGQVLEYNGSNWIPTNLPSSLPPSGPAGGDLSGTYPNPTVSAIRNNSITAQTLGVGQSNYALVWSGTAWSAQNVFLNQSAGGDLGDFYPNPTTRALWNAAIPEVLPSNPGATTGFAIGNVLQVIDVTANNQALGYGTLSLGTGVLSPNVNGILGASFQAPQFLSGDLSGNTNGTGSAYNSNSYGATVTAIQTIPVEHVSLGLSQDGYVLTYVNSSGQWEPQPSTTGSSLAGDITGATSSTNVAKLQGINLTVSGGSAPSSGQFLKYNGSVWLPSSATVTLINDVTGSSNVNANTATTVVAIQGNSILAQSLGSAQDGYVLTWINSASKWEAIENAGGSGAFVAGGDLSGSSVDQTVIKINGTSVPASPSAHDVLIASNSTTSSWSLISDVNVSGSANIAGSKIDTTTGGIVSIVASNTIQSAISVATTSVTIGGTYGTAPSITVGTGIPSSTPPDGSIFLRTDGDGSGTESIYSYEGSAWVPVGAAAAGTAGGDLSGFYPNPTVIAIQKNAVDSTILGATQDGYVLTWVNADNEWKAEVPSAGTPFSAGGDLSGTSTSQNVIKIHGATVPVSGSLITGNVLQVNGSSSLTYAPINVGGGSAFITGVMPAGNQAAQTMSGDVSGTTASSTVIALQGNPVLSQSLGYLDDGYVLTWINASSHWEAYPASGGGIILSGDVTGPASANTVVNINGTSVPAAPTANQVLVATSSSAATWELLTNSQISSSAGIAVSKLAAGTAGQILLNSSTPTPTWTSVTGDITLSNTGVVAVTKIQGNTVTSGALTKGDFFVATSTSNWAEVALTGDIAASAVTPGLTTVIALQTNPIEFQTLTSDDDGYVLTWHNAGPYWYAAPAASGSFSAGGDLSGTSSDQTVESIQGVVISGTPSTGYVLEATSPTAASWQPAASGSFSAGGDLSGSSTDQTVIGLQTVSVSTTTPTNGQVLTYVSADSKWEPQTPSSGSGAVAFDDSAPGADSNIIKNNGQALIDNTQSGIVNLGSFANADESYSISSIVFGGYVAIVTTSAPNSFLTNDMITISGALGTPEVNGVWNIAYVPSSTEFEITASIGASIELVQDDPNGSGEIQIIADMDTPLITGDTGVIIAGVVGTTEANGTWTVTMDTFNITNITTNTSVYGEPNWILVTVGNNLPYSIPTSAYYGYTITGVVGTTEANGIYTDIFFINANQFLIYNSNFTNAYVSGGTVTSHSSFLLDTSTFVNPYSSGGTIQYSSYTGSGIVTPYSGVYNSYSAILSGDQNYVDGYYSVIVGGNQNAIFHAKFNSSSSNNVITGGQLNLINVSGDGYNIINGGSSNRIGNDGDITGGVPTDSSSFNYVEGYNNIINNGGTYNHVEGQNQGVYNAIYNTHVEGSGHFLDSGVSSSHIEGTDNQGGGNTCHIEGNLNQVNDNSSYTHVEGSNNSITGDLVCSHIEGYNNSSQSGADYAHVQGENALVSHESQDVMASGSFSQNGDAQVSNLVFRGQGVGTFTLGFGSTPQNLPLYSAVTSLVVEANAQDITVGAGGDYAVWNQTHLVFGYSSGSPYPAEYFGFSPYISAGASTISNVQNLGSTIQITTTLPNNFATGQTLTIINVGGTTEANGSWVITTIDSSNFTLNGSVFVNAYDGYGSIPGTITGANIGGSASSGVCVPNFALNNSADPYDNWTLTAGLDGSGFFQLTFTDNSGSGDTIAVVAVVRFVENNAT